MAVPVQAVKHITDIKPFHPLGQKVDVFAADWPYIQDLGLSSPFKTFDKKAQDIADIVSWLELRIKLLFWPIDGYSGSCQGSLPFLGLAGQGDGLLGCSQGRHVDCLASRRGLLLWLPFHLDNRLEVGPILH